MGLERIISTPAWRLAMRQAIRSGEELLRRLDLLDREDLRRRFSAAAAAGFPLLVPAGFVDRMVAGDGDDPLLRQVLPAAEELESKIGFTLDPLGERQLGGPPGLLHKYRGRALLVLTGGCAVHCRYCFRRHFPYDEERPGSGWSGALSHLRRQRDVEEVIWSGGDPLLLADDQLADLAARLDDIPHLRRLRIHTRLPIVLPERVDDALLAWLGRGRLRTVVVVHVNHANEVDERVEAAVRRIGAARVTLLNQAVLLRGVNDSVAALCDLGERLFEAGVLPYYLHLLDPVAGAAHFDVPEAEAVALLHAVRSRLPGYLVPRLVREEPGAPSKVPR